ncbi:MAG: cysteine desulfurase [Verrucomicrobiales bacterium]|nr:cysteine desulfurase [Verrucomicrobiales bacterium]
MREVYLDHLSATRLLPEVLEAMRPVLTENFGSPASLHRHGLRAREALNQARVTLASLIQAGAPEEIILTSGGTEAANLAIKGTAWASQKRGNHIVTSAIEHPSVLNSIEFLEKQGFTATRVPVDAQGRIAPEAIREAITEQTILICVHHANHDVGTIQPVQQVVEVSEERGIPVFVDATASAGWLPVDVQQWGAALVSLAPHRFYGPKGVGVLYKARQARLQSLVHGGMQEQEKRAGTENLPAIVGAGAAAIAARRDLPKRLEHVSQLQRRLWERLKTEITHARLNGPPLGDERLYTNLNISFEFVEGEGITLMADMQGLSIASGAACVSKALKASPVLTAMGVPHALAQGNVILSLGQENTEEEMGYTADVLARIVQKLRGMSPSWEEFRKGFVPAMTPASAQ